MCRPIHRVFTLLILQFSIVKAFHTSYHSTTNRKQKTHLSSSIGEICGISYNEPLFRPPAEWRSLILQVTIGCSWNKCTFCEMDQDKKFEARKIEEITKEIDQIVFMGGAPYVRDIFLADGDAMTLPTKYLEKILDIISKKLPNVRRVSSYCLPRNIRQKSIDDLKLLQQKGLKLVYVGCESGDNFILENIQKGETFDTSLDALTKLKDAGIKRSVMILLGLGGKLHSEKHALNSALLCSKSQPEFLSVLTTSFPRGKERIEKGFSGTSFIELSPRESLSELEEFLDAIDIPHKGKTVFRSDHSSNYLVLKGRLGRDKERLLSEIQHILDSSPEDDQYNLRPEWARDL